jgi:hypothetical protein
LALIPATNASENQITTRMIVVFKLGLKKTSAAGRLATGCCAGWS